MRISSSTLVGLACLAPFALAAGGALAVVACSDAASTTTITPITAIVISSEALIAGKGCGRAPTQVLKYAAVVVDANGRAVANGLYDCFADGQFVNLAPGAYSLEVFAYNSIAADAAGDDLMNAASPDSYRELRPTWKTTCHATQQQDIQVLAVCEPLTVTGSGQITIPTDTFALGTMNSGSQDSGTDATPDADAASTDAGDAGDAGSGNDAAGASDADAASASEDAAASALQCGTDYTQVTATLMGAGGSTRVQDATCPNVVTFDDVAGPADVLVTVDLSNAAGPVGRAVCHATTTPGLSTNATCDPVERR